MNECVKLPIGIDDFKKLRQEGFYYVDKTALIEQLLNNWSEVNLFIRPRWFGKTLNMSMLKAFFEIGTDQRLFDGLYIEDNVSLCDAYMGKFPVIFITLKGVEGLTFEETEKRFIRLVGEEAERFSFLADSENLSEGEKHEYQALIAKRDGKFVMDGEGLLSSLKILSRLLCRHCRKKAVILIDEYDVPLDKAFQNGYYREMVSLIRGIFGNALKTNEFLQFAVLTGCLHISKESIFTGLNNFRVHSVINLKFDEQFGFTDEEVRSMLGFYGIGSHMEKVKTWYDGYRFGDTDIYCPWDVVNYIYDAKDDPEAEPQAYWINSSGNGLVKRFIDKADKTTRDEIEKLMNGEAIEKRIRLELTYEEIDRTIDNVWSVLFTTGYLTMEGKPEGGVYKLRIPNEEVKEVYRTQISDWFKETIQEDKGGLQPLWKAFSEGDAFIIEDILTKIMSRTISVLDPKGSETEKEKFYHALLAGILIGNGSWGVASNKESGEGFADLMVETDDINAGLIIEVKIADKITELDRACERAMAQIYDRRYDEYLRNEGRSDIWAYGIAFYKKRCRVVAKKMEASRSEN